jgi:hypothetical protein
MIIAQLINCAVCFYQLKELLFELVLKNLYILTTNIAGLAIETDSTVDELRNNHLKLMRNVSSDILKLQSALTGKTFAEDALEKGMLLAFEGDLSHQCMGRSAPQRLKRTLELALDNLKHNSEALLVLFGGKNCGVCQTIKPQIDEKFSDKFPNLLNTHLTINFFDFLF